MADGVCVAEWDVSPACARLTEGGVMLAGAPCPTRACRYAVHESVGYAMLRRSRLYDASLQTTYTTFPALRPYPPHLPAGCIDGGAMWSQTDAQCQLLQKHVQSAVEMEIPCRQLSGRIICCVLLRPRTSGGNP